MFNQRELNGLVEAMRASGVTTLDVKNSRQRLRVVLPELDSLCPKLSGLPKLLRDTAKSPAIGTFLRRGIDDGLQPLKSGMHVETGDILGYVCHGLIRVVISASFSGVLCDLGPKNGAALQVGDTVFNLEVTS